MSRVRVAQVHAYGYPWAPTAHVDFCFGHIRHSRRSFTYHGYPSPDKRLGCHAGPWVA